MTTCSALGDHLAAAGDGHTVINAFKLLERIKESLLWDGAAPGPFGLIVEHVKENGIDAQRTRIDNALIPSCRLHDGDGCFGSGG